VQHAIGQGGRYRRHIPFEGEKFIWSWGPKTSEIIKRRKLFFCSSCDGGPSHFFSHLKEAPSQADRNTILRHFVFSGVALTDLGDLTQLH
jgi:hypothetical protein